MFDQDNTRYFLLVLNNLIACGNTKDEGNKRFLAVNIGLYPALFEWQQATTRRFSPVPVLQTAQKAELQVLRR